MLSFLFQAPNRRRRANSTVLSQSLNALESRQLPSATLISSASLEQLASHPKGTPLDYNGNWKINGNAGLTLTLSQNGNNKLSGSLFAANSISVNIHGKVDDHMSFRGKGTFNGQTARITFSVHSTEVKFGQLTHFSGDMSLKFKGVPMAFDTLTADRI